MQGLAEREDLGRDAWGVHGVEGQGGKCDGPCSHLNSEKCLHIGLWHRMSFGERAPLL